MVRPTVIQFPHIVRSYIMDTRERLLFSIVIVLCLTYLVETKAMNSSDVTPMFTAILGYFFGAGTRNRREDRKHNG